MYIRATDTSHISNIFKRPLQFTINYTLRWKSNPQPPTSKSYYEYRYCTYYVLLGGRNLFLGTMNNARIPHGFDVYRISIRSLKGQVNIHHILKSIMFTLHGYLERMIIVYSTAFITSSTKPGLSDAYIISILHLRNALCPMYWVWDLNRTH